MIVTQVNSIGDPFELEGQARIQIFVVWCEVGSRPRMRRTADSKVRITNMRKSFRKVMALLLVAATMTGFSALGVNATATYQTKQQTIGVTGSTNASYVVCCFRYYYDTNNIDILTRVAAYSDYIGMYSTTVTPGNENVYLYNTVTVTYANGLKAKRVCRSNSFYPKGNVHIGETKMIATDPELGEYYWLYLNSAYRTSDARTGHGLSTYISTQHTQDESITSSVYPKTGESLIYYTTQAWK